MPDSSARFWAKVSSGPGECWTWTGAPGSDGYGRLKVKAGDAWVHVRAHRFAWQLLRGPIPDGLLVLHRCDVPMCVNPDHLFLGTDEDNRADKIAKGRQARAPRLPHGESHGLHRLTAESVVAIREQLASGELPRQAIATRFGVCKTTVAMIAQGKTWKHVPGSA